MHHPHPHINPQKHPQQGWQALKSGEQTFPKRVRKEYNEKKTKNPMLLR